VSDFLSVSEFASQYTPHGWPGDGPRPDARIDQDEGPALPPEESETLPLDADDEPALPPENDDTRLARVPDEVLDPVSLVPAASILARLEVLPAVVAAKTRAVQLVAAANAIGHIASAGDRDLADALRDDLKAHDLRVEEFLGPLCDAANRLHKGATGIRSFCKGDVLLAAKRLGDGIATSIRVEQEAEAARLRKLQQEALEGERRRLRAEAEAAEVERQRLASEAVEASRMGDEAAAETLRLQADQEQQNARQALQDAVSATAPPIASEEIVKPAGSSTVDNWQALPAHGEDRDDMPLADKIALIIHVGRLLQRQDGSLVHLLAVDWKAAKAMAKAQQNMMQIPGLRAVNPPTYRKTSKG
jgi:hypothetical protein